MGKPGWQFTQRRPSAGRARNSQVEKFFRSDVVEDQTNALVREGIQNSLDAWQSNGSAENRSVNVQISFGECSHVQIADFVPGLFEHLAAVSDKLAGVPDRDEPVRYLAFEDFNTTGLNGDPLEWDPVDNKNSFFNFFRGEGVTNKEGNQRGRHGVGKMVFSTASRAHSIFGLTATETRSPMLMGTSTLVLHHLGGKSYDPDGWFGIETTVDGGDKLVGPIDDPRTVKRFSKAFSLNRDDLPGLSIVVPWLEDSITAKSALQAVVSGFFWPVLQKQLYANIKDEAAETTISAANLSQLADEVLPPDSPAGQDLRATIDLALWAIERQAKSIPEAVPAASNSEWNSERLPEALKLQLRDELLAGDPVAIRVPMEVRLKKGTAKPASFDIYLRQDPECREGSIQFIREGLLIPGVKCARCPGHRALVIIDPGPLASFLGDAENPSHTEWQEQSVHDKYTYPRPTLNYVRQSVPKLLKILHEGQKTADATLLLDLFSLPTTEENSPKKKKPKSSGKNGDKTGGPVIPPLVPKPRRFNLQKRSAGFVIGPGAAEAETPRFLDVAVAYAARRGTPLKKYRPADFRLESKAIEVKVAGGEVQVKKDNHLRVEVTSPQFEISVGGFDMNRDLYIDVKVDSEETEDADAAEA